MPDELENSGVEAAFQELVRRARRGERTPLFSRGTSLLLTCLGPPESIAFRDVTALMDYARSKYGINLMITGGGYGCLDIGFSAEGTPKEVLENAIETDVQFQRHLNATKSSVAVVTAASGEQTCFAAYHRQEMYVTTNRIRESGDHNPRTGVTNIFGSGVSETLNYGIAEILIYDPLPHQNSGGWLVRLWHRINPIEFNRKSMSVIVTKYTSIALETLPELQDAQWLLFIHGYANSFDQALHQYAVFSYRLNCSENRIQPMLYSWPSFGRARSYFHDVNQAEQSEALFLKLVDTISHKGTPLNLLAHSHGNKILVRSFNSLGANKLSTQNIRKIVLIAPDVDERWFRNQTEGLIRVTKDITVYVSRTDEAMRISSMLNGGTRVGQSLSDLRSGIVVIDASGISKAWIGHAYHFESSQVLGDIFYLLKNITPAERLGLRKSESWTNTWTLT